MAFFTNLLLSVSSWSRGRSYEKYLPTMLQLLDPKKDEVLLDVGAGTGCIANTVAKYCDNVYALEPNNERVEFIKEHYPEVKAFTGRVESIPFPETYFDKIYVVSALHHFPAVDGAIDEMVRVLKPLGRLLVHDYNPERIPLGARLERRFMKERIRFVPPAQLQEKVEAWGLRTVQLNQVLSSFFLLAEKE